MHRVPSEAKSYPGGQEHIKPPGVLVHCPLLQIPCCKHSLTSTGNKKRKISWKLMWSTNAYIVSKALFTHRWLAFTHLRVLMSAFCETWMTFARISVHGVDTFSSRSANFRSQSALVHQIQYRLIHSTAETEFYVFGYITEQKQIILLLNLYFVFRILYVCVYTVIFHLWWN